ncbi:hypothetical protein DENIS_3349 [Desulfonema ishimotonii]|uniref:Uncharacterized protein n=1 Tax=Desulfonema ishimotonii TaxID=45657 RepID=A0A401FZK3_9BACT|nr:hypothetical protein DENIS_3349 [Desulfonema ishimotonii]
MKIRQIILFLTIVSIYCYTSPKAGSAYHGEVHKKITSVAITKVAVFNERLTEENGEACHAEKGS